MAQLAELPHYSLRAISRSRVLKEMRWPAVRNVDDITVAALRTTGWIGWDA